MTDRKKVFLIFLINTLLFSVLILFHYSLHKYSSFVFPPYIKIRAGLKNPNPLYSFYKLVFGTVIVGSPTGDKCIVNSWIASGLAAPIENLTILLNDTITPLV